MTTKIHLPEARFEAFVRVASFTLFVTIFSGPTAVWAVVEDVIWTNLVNVTATGNSVRRTSGCDGCDDAGATSHQQVASGDVYVEFSLPEAGVAVAGLSRVNTAPESASIDFSIRTAGPGGGAAVYENGVYKADIPHQLASDVFRVAVESGAVKYYHNGTSYYTSANAPTYPVLADAAIFNLNAAVTNAVISVPSLPPLCGRSDDLVYTPPQYTDPLPRPIKGASYSDPAFGCVIKRISDGPNDPDLLNTAHHEYSIMTPFNSNNTLLLLHTCCLFFIADLNGNVIRTPAQLGIAPYQEPRWSKTEPNVFYFPQDNPYPQDDYFMKYVVGATPADDQRTILYTFSGYNTVDLGGGSSDLSEDGTRVAIRARSPAALVDVILLKISPEPATVVASRTFTEDVELAGVTPNNNVLVSPLIFSRVDLYTVNPLTGKLDFVRTVITFAPHMDIGRDVNGDEIIVAESSSDPSSACGNSNGIEKIRMSDSQKTCILAPLSWRASTHMSVSDNGWVIVSHVQSPGLGTGWPTDPDDLGTANPPDSLPMDWESRWLPHHNEVILLKVDGSGKRRLAHHRTRRCGSDLPNCWDGQQWLRFDPYWSTPRAAISRDGSYVVFDSNFAVEGDRPDYTDVYLIDVRQ